MDSNLPKEVVESRRLNRKVDDVENLVLSMKKSLEYVVQKEK